jgi:hypothetical protein
MNTKEALKIAESKKLDLVNVSPNAEPPVCRIMNYGKYKYAQHGYTVTKTHSYPGRDGQMHSKVHTYWTQKGRLFIYELLKKHGILPLIEQEVR